MHVSFLVQHDVHERYVEISELIKIRWCSHIAYVEVASKATKNYKLLNEQRKKWQPEKNWSVIILCFLAETTKYLPFRCVRVRNISFYFETIAPPVEFRICECDSRDRIRWPHKDITYLLLIVRNEIDDIDADEHEARRHGQRKHEIMNTKWKSIGTAAIRIHARHTMNAMELWHSFASTKEENAFAYIWIRFGSNNNNNIFDDMCNFFRGRIQAFHIISTNIPFHRSNLARVPTAVDHKNATFSPTAGAKEPFISFSFCAALWLNCTSAKRSKNLFDRCTSINSFGGPACHANNRIRVCKLRKSK